MILLLLLTLRNCNLFLILCRLTGEEEQIGGFDVIYSKTKIKSNQKNFSFLGCLNNRVQQMRKMAKNVALKLAD